MRPHAGDREIFGDALRDLADLCACHLSRFVGDGRSADITRIRSAGNHVLSRTVNLLFGTRYTDLCYGYNAFWYHCLHYMGVTSNGFEIETQINIRLARTALEVTEVPSVEHVRLYGESKLSTVRDGIRVLRTILRERVRWNVDAVHGDGWRPVFRELPHAPTLGIGDPAGQSL